MGIPHIGWFLMEITIKILNGWFGGTTLSGNLHIPIDVQAILSKEVWKSNFRQYGQMAKQRWEESRRRRKEVRRSEKRKREKKEDPGAGARKGKKVAIHYVFPRICGSGGSKNRLAKAAGAKPAGQMRDEKLQALAARSTCPSQNVQNTPGSDHFWKLRCRKVHAVVVRSTFPSQNAQRKTPGSDHCRKLRRRKSARRCGAKNISKSKVEKNWRSRTTVGSWDVEKVHAVVARRTFPSQKWKKTDGPGPLSEVETSKKCTPLWREEHFQVKSGKKLTVPDHCRKLRRRKSARRCGAKNISKSKVEKNWRSRTTSEVEMSKKCTPLWREAHFQV